MPASFHSKAASIVPKFNGTVQAVIPLDGDNDGVVSSRPTGLDIDDALILVGGKFSNVSDFDIDFQTTSSLSLPQNIADPIPDTSLPQDGKLHFEALQLTELVSKQFLNFGTLIEGLERLLEWGDRVLGRDFLDRKIPFIGKSVRDGLNFLESDQPGAKTLRTVIQGLISGSLELTLGFGLTKNEGFFLLTNLPGPEFKIGGTISADVDLAAKLGMLDVNLSIEPGSNLSVDFSTSRKFGRIMFVGR